MSGNPTEQPRVSVESPSLPLPPPEELREAAMRRLLHTLNADEIAALAERLEGSVQPQAGVGARAELPPHIVPGTREDIARNDLSVKALPQHLFGIEKFLPELQKKKPGQILHILSERFSKDPTPVNAALLQHAVNRITSGDPVESQLKHELTKALQVFHKKPSG